MAFSLCSVNALVGAAAVLLLLVPSQYYVGYRGPEPVLPPPPPLPWHELALAHLPPLELLGAAALLLLAFITYLCEWIQRKIVEKRIVKLNQYLSASLERMRAWDARQEQLESTLKLVQNATSEYNLLLYLALRPQRSSPAVCPPPAASSGREWKTSLF